MQEAMKHLRRLEMLLKDQLKYIYYTGLSCKDRRPWNGIVATQRDTFRYLDARTEPKLGYYNCCTQHLREDFLNRNSLDLKDK